MLAVAPTHICKRNMVKRLAVEAAQGDWEGLGFLMAIEEIDPKEYRVRQHDSRRNGG